MPAPLDYLILALIVIVVPLRAYAERQRLERALASGAADARLRAYRRILAWQWISTAVLLAIWLGVGRPLSLLGVKLPHGSGFWSGVAIFAVAAAGLFAQLHAVRTSPQVAEQVRAATASLRFLLPVTRRELRVFTWLGVTAGIVEELLCRGYMIWVLRAVVPTWAALVLSSVAFGAGHAYQGLAGVFKTSAVGLGLGGLYLLTGSIWMPILLHAVVDVLSGETSYAALESKPGESPN